MDPHYFIARVSERLRVAGISERQASIRVGLGPTYLRDMRDKPRAPRADVVLNLANLLDTTPSYLLGIDEAVLPGAAYPPLGPVARVTVRGAVEAGAWHREYEWPQGDRYEIVVPQERRLGGGEPIGLVVCGSVMDAVFPDGSIVVASRFTDIGQLPKKGQRVVVVRRRHHDRMTEVTLWEYEIDRHGRHILWPRSLDPDHQAPIILPQLANGRAASKAGLRWEVDGTELEVVALVTSSIRPEPI